MDQRGSSGGGDDFLIALAFDWRVEAGGRGERGGGGEWPALRSVVEAEAKSAMAFY